MTLTCSHEGCNIAENGSVDFKGVYCSCHGSHFTNNGSAVSGPAPDPLQHFAVELDSAGQLTIHGAQNVPASTRTAVA
jgi:Rieske Fe-S protein